MDNENYFKGCQNHTFDIKTRFLMEVNIPLILEDNSNLYLDLFKSIAVIIKDDVTGDKYYYVPQYFKCVGDGNFEVLNFNQLPECVIKQIKVDIIT